MVARQLDRDLLQSLPTPCLVVDLAAVDRNIARAVEIAPEGSG